MLLVTNQNASRYFVQSPGRGDCLFLSVAAALFVAAFESYLDFDSTELKDTASSLREVSFPLSTVLICGCIRLSCGTQSI